MTFVRWSQRQRRLQDENKDVPSWLGDDVCTTCACSVCSTRLYCSQQCKDSDKVRSSGEESRRMKLEWSASTSTQTLYEGKIKRPSNGAVIPWINTTDKTFQYSWPPLPRAAQEYLQNESLVTDNLLSTSLSSSHDSDSGEEAIENLDNWKSNSKPLSSTIVSQFENEKQHPSAISFVRNPRTTNIPSPVIFATSPQLRPTTLKASRKLRSTLQRRWSENASQGDIESVIINYNSKGHQKPSRAASVPSLHHLPLLERAKSDGHGYSTTDKVEDSSISSQYSISSFATSSDRISSSNWSTEYSPTRSSSFERNLPFNISKEETKRPVRGRSMERGRLSSSHRSPSPSRGNRPVHRMYHPVTPRQGGTREEELENQFIVEQ